MKILFLAQLFPLPLDSGGKIKSYYTLKNLAKEHEVHLLAFVRSPEELSHLEEMQDICASVKTVDMKRTSLTQASDLAGNFVKRQSFIIRRDYRKSMQRVFDRMVGDGFDVVYIDHLQMASYVNFNAQYKTVLDNHNIEHLIIKRIFETTRNPLKKVYAYYEYQKLAKFEMQCIENADMCLFVSDVDRDYAIRHTKKQINAHTVPIGVDTDFFYKRPPDEATSDILFAGTMHWPPNIDCVLHFSEEILPIIAKNTSEYTFTVAGQKPPEYIVRLAKPGSQINVTGYVDDIRDYMKKCGVFVVPLRSGSGVRVKILNAMSMGLPIVSTSIGAEGIDAVDGKHLVIADDCREFAKAVHTLLANRAIACNLGENARGLVENRYSWDMIGELLLEKMRMVSEAEAQ